MFKDQLAAIGLLTLLPVAMAAWAIWTGEVPDRRGRPVLRRADAPVLFYSYIGFCLFFAAVVLDMTVGFGLLMKLVNWNL